ncbi:MAG: tetratricopeptide repeat protein [Acidobacteriota bacterium]
MAMYVLTLYGKKTEAANFATTAGNIHKEVLQIEPDLVDAKTSTAVPEYVVGSLPFGIRWIGLLMGIHGDKQGAMEKLNEVVDKGIYRAPDALLVMGALNVWKGDARTAVSSFARMRKMYERNFLLDIGLAVAYEEAEEDPMAAIGVYNELLDNLAAKAPGIYPGELHFRIGKSYAKLEDYNEALLHFQKALDSKKGDAETEPLGYYNMAQVYEELGQKKQAKGYYRLAAQYSGSTLLIKDEIKRARKKSR